ncbi:MAG TPA: isoprenylcysteine carboxylmethyltransferase family protein [Terracidiphilus sp.]|jgi:protein-S-isoprenylcysteine O-methyltransferase Ste14
MPSLRGNIVISALFTIFGGPGILLVLIPWMITRFRVPLMQPLWQTCLAVVLIGIGLVPLFESIVRFIVIGSGTLVPAAPPQHLVVSGLYRFVRNPMYVGVMTALGGEALLFGSVDLFEILLIIALGFHLFVYLYEEPKLTRTFGDEYLRYRRHVRRWIPRLTPWQG